MKKVLPVTAEKRLEVNIFELNFEKYRIKGC
jgi:hypothetical protein